MQEQSVLPMVEKVRARDLYSQLKRISVFEKLREEDASCLGDVELIHAPIGSILSREGETSVGFWALLSGEIKGYKRENENSKGFLLQFHAGESFGEVPLLTGRPTASVTFEVVSEATLVGIGDQGFWQLMAACPIVRGAILVNMERRLQSYQAFAVHREKLISLGTLAAGLMHELNNPGSAARRAATQLRENMVRLQQISLRFCEAPMAHEQIDCMKELQTRALSGQKPMLRSSLDQSDAEECLAEWLEGAGVENSWKMAPTLTEIGITELELDCTRHAFPGNSFSDALNWLTSLVSNMQLVTTIEESITRVSELVTAVKKYSYNETEGKAHPVDIHDGLRSTLTILGHKFRSKDLKIDQQFASELPVIESQGVGLTQVWTNLLDNAVDASPERGTIFVRTWVEEQNVCIAIADQGSGIPEEHQAHIFDAFFTTKPVGVGTGLGLEIVHRIVVGSYGGKIDFTSAPGQTEFVVRIPIHK